MRLLECVRQRMKREIFLLCFGRRRLIEPGVVADFCRLITLSHEPR